MYRSTWAKYKANINQTTVLDFAKQINKNNFPNSQIEIDDKWEACYGTLKFDNKKFPNATDMVSQLHKMGFRVTLWLHPFINNNCQVKDKEKYMVHDENNKVWPVKWWNGDAATIDFTDEQAVNWFVSRIQQLKHETGIDSFKFDAGEFSWIVSKLKKGFKFHNSNLNKVPNLYTKFYASAVSRLGKMIEVRVGFDTQNLPIYVRMLDKLTGWSEQVGLRTLIPTALQMSLAGYPFVLPDMIGGNAYGNYPTKELFIRWLQVNALMPSLQFSIAPWDFNDTQITKISQKMVQLHLNFSSLITKLANETVSTGDPIMRPIWWIAPEDNNTYSIGDEFLLGNDVLVAPVVYENARKRDVYLPAGNWIDHREEIHKGDQWIRNFKVEIEELAYFQKQN